MDLHKKLALVTLEGPLLDWMDDFGDDHPDLADDVMTLLHRVDMVRHEATLANIAEIEIAMSRHPSQRGRANDR